MVVSGYKNEQVWVNIGKDLIWVNNDVNFLGLLLIEV